MNGSHSFYILTLGCSKNQVDSEHMAQLLLSEGYREVEALAAADFLIVNTCGFIAPAKRESIEAILSLGTQKRPGQRLVAAGCLAERYGRDLLAEILELDGVLGTRRWAEMPELLEAIKAGGRPLWVGDPAAQLPIPPRRAAPTSYLKIAEGCSAGCAFCAIPAIKGPMRSKPLQQCVAEAHNLAAQGAQEVVLIAQDTTAYGLDLGLADGLSVLVENILREVPSLPWLRLMYTYPQRITPRLIEVVAGQPRITKYLDIPLQHAHPDTLRRMQRPPEGAGELIESIRAAVPGIALRTTFMVGYPGETETEFRVLLDFMSAMRFDWAGVFTYSAEEGTEAASLPGQVPARVARSRYRRAMALQQGITRQRNQEQVGRVLQVLVEGQAEGIPSPPRAGEGASNSLLPYGSIKGSYGSIRGSYGSVGRSYREAPEVDGLILLDARVDPGQMVRARITSALTYDLAGTVLLGRQ